MDEINKYKAKELAKWFLGSVGLSKKEKIELANGLLGKIGKTIPYELRDDPQGAKTYVSKI